MIGVSSEDIVIPSTIMPRILVILLLAVVADGRGVRRVSPRSTGPVARRAVPAARRGDGMDAPRQEHHQIILDMMMRDEMGCLPPRELLLADRSRDRANSDAEQKRAARRDVVDMYSHWLW